MNVKRHSLFLLMVWLAGCAENPGVIPVSGTDETVVDPIALTRAEKDKRIDPNAERLAFPRIDLKHPESFPMLTKDLIPRRKRGMAVILVGEISYPFPGGNGGLVTVKFRPKVQASNLPLDADGKNLISHSIQGGAKAPPGQPAGEWNYELNGKYPTKPGRYEVMLQVLHRALLPDVSKLPTEAKVVTTTVIESEVTVE